MRNKYTITLSDRINQKLDDYSKNNGISRSSVIEIALIDLFDKSKSPPLNNSNELLKKIENQDERLNRIEAILNPDDHIMSVFGELSKPRKMDYISMIEQLEPNKMYRQSDLFQHLPDAMQFNSKKATVSRAVAQGFIETNGEKGKKCRVKGSSAIKWLNKYRKVNDE